MSRHGHTFWKADWEKLMDAVEVVCRYRGISLRQVARETGMPPSSLTRIRQGRAASADSFVTLCQWLGESRGHQRGSRLRYLKKNTTR